MWKIAIIDDDRKVLRGMRQLIPWEELNAEWAGEGGNGRQGVELIRDVQPDIVITDIYMPLMNGLEMIEKVREDRFEGKIIIHSAYSDFEYARQALRLNVEDYLSKPISMNTLRTILAKAIGELEQKKQKQAEQEHLQKKLKLYEPFVAKESMKGLVTGTLDFSQYAAFLPSQPNASDHDRCAVMGIELVRTERLSDVSIPDWRLFRFAVNNIMEEVVRDSFAKVDFINLNSFHYAVIFHFGSDADETEAAERLRHAAKNIIHYVRNTLQISLRAAIGTVTGHWRQLADSAEEVFQALMCKDAVCRPHIEMIEYCPEGNAAEKHKQTIDFMLQYIQDHYAEDITLCDLADKVYISRNYLSDIFKKATGDSFNVYLTRVRMEKARALILDGKMHVYQVAKHVGYKNVPYFSTLFKKYTGMNPTELAK